MKGTTSLQPRRMKMTTIRMAVAFLAVAVLGAVGIAINQDSGVAQAQSFMPPDLLHVIDPLSSLKSIPVPEPRNIARYIKDRNAAIALGKALFWDMAVGSDGQRSEEHTSELQSLRHLVCRLLLEKKKQSR